MKRQGKERKTDKLFRDYIRTRDGWRCLACGDNSKDYSQNKQGLHCSHYWGRGHENTRFDPENCISLCTYHHIFDWGHGDGRDKYKAFMIDWLGEDRFLMLEVRAHLTKKRDDNADEIIIRQMIKELEIPPNPLGGLEDF